MATDAAYAGAPSAAVKDRTPRRITMVLNSLGAGGAEWIGAVLANAWSAQGRRVTLITLDDATRDLHRLGPGVSRVALDVLYESRHSGERVVATVRRVLAVRRAVCDSRPDVIWSRVDRTNLLTLLATIGLRVPVVVCEAIDPTMYHLDSASEVMRRALYPRAAKVVLQLDGLRPWAERVVSPKSVAVIPNPAVFPPATRMVAPRKQQRVVAMGRLCPQKGFDLLIRAFARCAPAHPGWRLVIFGEGPERIALERLAREAGVHDRVSLPGVTRDPWRELASSRIFVLSSRFEGFPNVLLQAMACGLAVIASDCRSGPSEIIRHGVDGLLVPAEDVDGLAAGIDRVIADETLRLRLGANAPAVLERFSLPKILDMWQQVFDDALSGSEPRC